MKPTPTRAEGEKTMGRKIIWEWDDGDGVALTTGDDVVELTSCAGELTPGNARELARYLNEAADEIDPPKKK